MRKYDFVWDIVTAISAVVCAVGLMALVVNLRALLFTMNSVHGLLTDMAVSLEDNEAVITRQAVGGE